MKIPQDRQDKARLSKLKLDEEFSKNIMMLVLDYHEKLKKIESELWA